MQKLLNIMTTRTKYILSQGGILLLLAIAAAAFILASSGCHKPHKTKAAASISFDIDGVNYTPDAAVCKITKYQKYIPPYGTTYGYMFVTPAGSYALQFNLRTTNLTAGQNLNKHNTIGYNLYEAYEHNGLEVALLWEQGKSYIADSAFNFDISSIGYGTASGTFSGEMIGPDTLHITSGTFTNVTVN